MVPDILIAILLNELLGLIVVYYQVLRTHLLPRRHIDANMQH